METLRCFRLAQTGVPSTIKGSQVGRNPLVALPHRPRRALLDGRCQATSTPDVAISPHPDALRRRKEAEERQKRLRERKSAGRGGDKWWETPGPQNLVTCESVASLETQLANAADEGHLLVVKFFAPHCAACKTMHPKIKQIAEQHDDVRFLKVNAGHEGLQSFCEQLGVTKVPYFHLYKDGKLVSHFSASLTTIKRVRSEVDAYKE